MIEKHEGLEIRPGELRSELRSKYSVIDVDNAMFSADFSALSSGSGTKVPKMPENKWVQEIQYLLDKAIHVGI